MPDTPEELQGKIDSVKLKIDEYKNEQEGVKKATAAKNVIQEISEKFGSEVPQELQDIVIASLDTNNSIDCRLLGHYFELLSKLDEAIEINKKSYEIDKSYKAQHNIAAIYLRKEDYHAALKHFDLCLKETIKDPKSHQRLYNNYGFSLRRIGDYKNANKTYQKLTKIFEEDKDQTDQYWLDFGDHMLYNLFDPFTAIKKYEEGLKINSPDEEHEIDMLLGLVNACGKCVALIPNDDLPQIGLYRRKQETYYNKVFPKLHKRGVFSDVKLGELYLYNRNLEKAEEWFKKLVTENPSKYGEKKPDLYNLLGLTYLYLDKHQNAIDKFLETTQNFYVKTNIAQCLTKLSKFHEAQDAYDNILYKAPYDTNALIGSAFLYLEWAESVKVSNPEKAVNYLDLSIVTARNLLEKHRSDDYLRKLTIKEEDDLQYAIAYCNIGKNQLIKQKETRIKLLREARTSLGDLRKKNDNAYYFKSNRTSSEIDEVIEDFKRSGLGRKKSLLWIGSIVAVISLVLIFLGKPVIQRGYLADTDLLASQLRLPKSGIDSIFKEKRFHSESEMQEYVELLYAEHLKGRQKPIVKTRNGSSEVKWHAVDTATSSLMIGISVVFLLLGFLSHEIKTLKIAGIEIEKSEQLSLIDQVEIKMSR